MAQQLDMQQVKEKISKQFTGLGWSVTVHSQSMRASLADQEISFSIKSGNAKGFEVDISNSDQSVFNGECYHDQDSRQYCVFRRFKKNQQGVEQLLTWLANCCNLPGHVLLKQMIDPGELPTARPFAGGEFYEVDGWSKAGEIERCHIQGIVSIENFRIVEAANPHLKAWFLVNVHIAAGDPNIITDTDHWHLIISQKMDNGTIRHYIHPSKKTTVFEQLSRMNVRDRALLKHAASLYAGRILRSDEMQEEEVAA